MGFGEAFSGDENGGDYYRSVGDTSGGIGNGVQGRWV
jgi:hypothetical protein